MSDRADETGSGELARRDCGATSPVHPAFALLHRGVQRQLYRMAWTELRPLQVEAIHALAESSRHVILAAGTASGKTEAAFLPILSNIADDARGSVAVLYVGPLKALINDQFRRVEELCQHLEVPVFRWHGDVSATHKKRLIEKPGGVLLITPESLESLFVNRSEHLGRLFGGLQFVVIDELHSFLRSDRGTHLRSLLCRLRHLGGGSDEVRLVGLSATIGDYGVAQRYLDASDPREVQIVHDENGEKEIRLAAHCYVRPWRDDPQEQLARVEDVDRRIAGDMVRHCRGNANLLFANIRSDVEEFARLCRDEVERQQLRYEFLVHHGSLSAEIREDAEAIMKSGRPATTICSATLEMGIDIGSVRMVGQIGAPTSVAGLTQRLGRSGRREGEPRILRLYLACEEPSPRANILDRLHLDLIQSIAVIDLMLEGWTEPDAPARCDLSTLTQQVISIIAQHGGATPQRLFEMLCRDPHAAFPGVEAVLFKRVLECLRDGDLIEGTREGDCILGLVGEHLRKDKGFYAVFQTAEEYSVLHQRQLLGTLEIIPAEGDYLLFAGKRWQVVLVDTAHHELHVEPAQGWKKPRFAGAAAGVHEHVRQRMKAILRGTESLPFLDSAGVELLATSRRVAREARVCEASFVPLGPRRTALMTWTGTQAQHTLLAMLAAAGVACLDAGIALVMDLHEARAREVVADLARRRVEPLRLGGFVQPRHLRKYDRYLNDELIDAMIARDRLDFDGAARVLNRMIEPPSIA